MRVHHSLPGVLEGVLLVLCDLLTGFMGESVTSGEGPEPPTTASLALRCHRAGGALGIGVSSFSSPCKSLSNRNCAIRMECYMGTAREGEESHEEHNNEKKGKTAK